jgi:hypothetical protein
MKPRAPYGSIKRAVFEAWERGIPIVQVVESMGNGHRCAAYKVAHLHGLKMKPAKSIKQQKP